MILIKNANKSKETFNAFNELSTKVFGLSFEEWYLNGYWTDKYISYTFFEKNRAIANVSANLIHTLVNDVPKLYIQIGWY